ncbi:MAG: CDP-glycerol glycerophosphotransferase family protein, partial [Mailhella sp.]|nr:CDP-glycerol glycerophosphotransferase family protein [Mailhella sp.]
EFHSPHALTALFNREQLEQTGSHQNRPLPVLSSLPSILFLVRFFMEKLSLLAAAMRKKAGVQPYALLWTMTMYITRNIRKFIYQIIYRFFYMVCRQKAICFIYGLGSHLYSNLAPVQAIAEHKLPVLVVADGKDSCFSALKKLACSKVLLLDQTNKYVSNISLGKKTTCIQCWHAGGAYKKVGFDAKRSGFSQSKEEKRITRLHKNIHYFVCSSEHVADIYAHAFHLPRQKMLTFGLPRMDSVLAQAAGNDQEKEAVILYAPTFRTGSDGRRYMPAMPDAEFLRQFFKDAGDIRFAFRSHPTVAHAQAAPGWENWSSMP